jgi:hypothetical protein
MKPCRQKPLSTHRVATAAFMMEKFAQTGECGGAHPPPFNKVTIMNKVAVYAPTEWADTLTLFHLYKYMLCARFYTKE